MIICKRPAHPDYHLQKASRSRWSFAKGWPIRMIICKRQPGVTGGDGTEGGERGKEGREEEGNLSRTGWTGSKALLEVLADLKTFNLYILNNSAHAGNLIQSPRKKHLKHYKSALRGFKQKRYWSQGKFATRAKSVFRDWDAIAGEI